MTLRKYLLKLLNAVPREDVLNRAIENAYGKEMPTTEAFATQEYWDTVTCHPCKKIFKSAHGLAIHVSRMHKV